MNTNYQLLIEAKLDEKNIQKQLDEIAKKHKGIQFNVDGVQKATKDFKELNNTLETSKQSFGDILVKVTKFYGATIIINEFKQAVRDGVQSIYEMDEALTEFQKVSDLSGKSLERFVNQAERAGKSVARSGKEMIEASTEFKKSGFDESESLVLGRVASLFQNIADTQISAGESSKFLTSQMKAFNIPASDAIKIIDSVNEVANNFAVGSNDLQSALSKTSSAMATLGNDFDQTLGLLTAGAEIMQGQSGKVARGTRSIGLELAKIAQEQRELEVIAGEVSIALYDEAGSLKSTFDILKDISPYWSQLTNEQKTNLGYTVAGKTQYEVFASVLDNFQSALDATATSQNSMGSAVKENEAVLDSIKGQLSELRAEFEIFSRKTLSSDTIKGLINVGTAMLKFANTDIGQTIKQVGLLTLAFKTLQVVTKTNLFLSLASGIQTFMVWMGIATAGTKGFTVAMLELKAVMLSHPLLLASAGIVALVKAIDLLNVSMDEHLDKIDSLKSEYESIKSEISDVTQKLEENKKVLDDINNSDAKVSLDTVNKIKLENTELERQLQILQKIEQEEKRKLSESTVAMLHKKESTVNGYSQMEYGTGIQSQYAEKDILQRTRDEIELAKATGKTTEVLRENIKILTDSKANIDLSTEANQALFDSISNLQDEYISLNQTAVKATEQFKEQNFSTVEQNTNFEELSNSLTEVQSAYQILASAQEQYNENGYVSLKTYQEVLNLGTDYLNMLFDENGNLRDLEESFRDVTEAKIDEMAVSKAREIINNAKAFNDEKTAVDELTFGYDSATTSLWDFITAGVTFQGFATGQVGAIKQQIEAVEQMAKSLKANLSTTLGGGGKSTSTRNVKDAWKEAFNQQHKELEHNLAMNHITESEYVDKLESLYKRYFGNRKEYLSEFYRYEEEVHSRRMKMEMESLNKQKEMYERTFSYLGKKADKEISELEQERKEEEDYYNRKIEALKNVNREKNAELQLEKAKEALRKAETTKKIIYQDGRMQYSVDASAVEKAKDALNQIEREQATQKEIERLEKMRDKTLESIEDQIEYWEDYKDEWREVVDEYSDEQDRLIAEQVLGIDLEQDNWETRLDNLRDFVEEYLRIMRKIDAGVEGFEEDDLPEKPSGGNRPNRPSKGTVTIKSNASKFATGERMQSWVKGRSFDILQTKGNKILVGLNGQATGWVYKSDLEGYAKGTGFMESDQIAKFNEEGNELIIPPHMNAGGGSKVDRFKLGTGIVPATITDNLMQIGKLSLPQFVETISKSIHSPTASPNYNFDKLILPNVTDFQSFLDALGSYSNLTLQALSSRE